MRWTGIESLSISEIYTFRYKRELTQKFTYLQLLYYKGKEYVMF